MLLQVFILAELLCHISSFPTGNTANFPSPDSILINEENRQASTASHNLIDVADTSITVIDTLTNHQRIKRDTEQTETFYRITEYKNPIDEDRSVIDQLSIYTTQPPMEAGHDSYRTYLETGYTDEKCKPESVMLDSNEDYLTDVVPGVRCNAKCRACEDGYTFQAVMYPMSALKVHRIGDTQTYYRTTRWIPVYCACFRDDDVDIYSEEDTSNPYDGFDSIRTESTTSTKDSIYNAEDTDDVYEAFDSKSLESSDDIYNAEHADDPYEGFETTSVM